MMKYMIVVIFVCFCIFAITKAQTYYEDDPDIGFLSNLDSRRDTNRQCHRLPRRGPCESVRHRWWYNPRKRNCERLDSERCRANGNSFATYSRCMDVCGDLLQPYRHRDERRRDFPSQFRERQEIDF